MASNPVKEADTGGSTANRTRVDDNDPGLTFSPGISPYEGLPSPWTVINDPIAYKGSAVMTNQTNAQLSFTFPGDSLNIALLYKAHGTNVRLVVDNTTTFPLEVTFQEAKASAPDGNGDALQKKIFRFTGLPCKTHTATLAVVDDNSVLYFDWFSYVSVDSPAACKPTDASEPIAFPTAAGANTDADSHDHTMKYVGIGVGAAVFGFFLALVTVLLCYRRRRRRIIHMDPPDHSYTLQRPQTSDETLTMPLNMSQRSRQPLIVPEPIFRPRGIHALAHDDSVGSANSHSSAVDSPSANAVSPLMPVSPGDDADRMEDPGFSIGATLLELNQRPTHGSRGVHRSLSSMPYERTRTSSATPPYRFSPSRSTPALVGGSSLHSVPHDTPQSLGEAAAFPQPSRPARRPCTASAADQAHELGIRRPLSPFDRSRPTTSAGTTSEPRLATTPATSAAQRFRRNSSCSADTHWSRDSADGSGLEPQEPQPRHDAPKSPAEDGKTTDSEAEMWISKQKIIGEDGRRRTNSSSGVPRRPPRSPYRPNTGQDAPPPLAYQPFTIS